MIGTTKNPNNKGFDLFITTAPIPDLNDKLVVFGQVINGQDIVQVLYIEFSLDALIQLQFPYIIGTFHFSFIFNIIFLKTIYFMLRCSCPYLMISIVTYLYIILSYSSANANRKLKELDMSLIGVLMERI